MAMPGGRVGDIAQKEGPPFDVPSGEQEHAAKKMRTMETSVGIPSAPEKPASPNLRIAEPVHTTLEATNTCNTPCCDTPSTSAFSVNESLHFCNLCGSDMDGHDTYMYRGMGFCTPECLYECYIDDEEDLYRFLVAGGGDPEEEDGGGCRRCGDEGRGGRWRGEP